MSDILLKIPNTKRNSFFPTQNSMSTVLNHIGLRKNRKSQVTKSILSKIGIKENENEHETDVSDNIKSRQVLAQTLNPKIKVKKQPEFILDTT